MSFVHRGWIQQGGFDEGASGIRTLPPQGGGGGQRNDKRGDAPRARYLFTSTNPNDHFFYFMVTMAYGHDDDDRKLPTASVGEEDDSDVEMEGE